MSYPILSLFYQRMHRPLLALTAMLPPPGALGLTQPAASACCSCGIVTTVIATIPNNPSAATMAIIAIDVVLFLLRDWWFTDKSIPEGNIDVIRHFGTVIKSGK